MNDTGALKPSLTRSCHNAKERGRVPGGNEKALNALVGQIMKAKPRASQNPAAGRNELLRASWLSPAETADCQRDWIAALPGRVVAPAGAVPTVGADAPVHRRSRR